MMTTMHALMLCAFMIALCHVHSQEAKDFPIDTEMSEVITVRQQFYRISLDEATIPAFLHIQTTETEYNQPAYIYVSGKSTTPSNGDRDYFSHELLKNNIFLPQVYLKGKKTIYVGVFCQKATGCSYRISNKRKSTVQISESSHLTFESNQEDEISFSPIEEGSKLLMFYAYGGQVDTFNMDIHYKDIFIETNQTWENGYSAIVDLSDPKYAEKKDFAIHIKTTQPRIVTVGVKWVDKIQNVLPYEGVFNYIPVGGYYPLCHRYTKLVEGHRYLLNVVLYIKNALFSLKSVDTAVPDPDRKVEMRNNSFIEFSYDELNKNLLCYEAVEKEKNSSLSFQLIDKDTIESYQRYIMPIVNGIQQKNFLPAGKVVHYRHWTYHSKAIQINLHSTKIKGNALLYSYKCDSYPIGCEVTQERIPQLVNEGKMILGNEINMQMTSITMDYNDLNLEGKSKHLMVIHCQGVADCEYTVEIDNAIDSIELVEGVSFSKPSNQGEVHFYHMKIFNPAAVKSIKIFLESVSGNADIEVFEDHLRTVVSTGIIYFAGSKEIVEIKPFQDIEVIKDAYYIQVQSKDKSFYSIRYRVNEVSVNEVPPGIMNTVEITLKERTKKYSFRDRNAAPNSKYVITVKAVNCRVKLRHEGKDYLSIKNINLQVSKSSPQLDPYSLEMTVESFDDGSENQNEYCVVILAGDEQSIDFPLVLLESNFYLHHVNMQDKEDYYLIPLVYNRAYNSLVVEVDFTVPAVLLATVFVKGKEVISNSRLSSFKKFVLSTEIEACTTVPLCPVMFKLSIENIFDSVDVPYKIAFKSTHRVPEYLRRNYMRNDEVFPGEYQHFYSDLKLNESGEVVVHFHKGSGQIFSKIIRKDVNEADADWNRRVKLPHKNMKNSLVYDYSQKKISFNSIETGQCKNGCEMYIAVLSDEVFIDEKTLTEYSIYLKNAEDTVTIPIKEYVSGNAAILNAINYYQLQLPYDSDRIVVNFKSPFGIMYINQGATRPTPEKRDITIAKGVTQYTIKASDLSKASFTKGEAFTIGVHLKEFVKNYSDYLFEVIPQKKGVVTYIEVRSDQPEPCQTRKDTANGCYFAIELPDYQKIEFFLIYAFLSHVGNKVEIYTSLIDKISFDTNPAEYIPAQGYEFDSKTSFDSRYLLISSDRLHLKKDFYAVVFVKTTEETDLNIMTSFNNLLEYTNLSPIKQHLYLITQSQSISFNLLGHSNQKIQATNLVGKGTLRYNQNIMKKLDATIVMFPINSATEEEFSITASSESIYGILVLIKTLPIDSQNIDILPFNELNNVIYKSNFFPQIFFIELPLNQIECSVNIKLSQYEKEEAIASSSDNFEIKGYIVPIDFYFEKIGHPGKEPSTSVANGLFLTHERVGYVGLTVPKAEALSKRYLYAKIEPAANNTHKYKQIQTEVMAYSKANFVEDFQMKKYFYSTIDSAGVKATFVIKKEFSKDRFARIEFGDCSGNLTYSIESHEKLTYSNESYILTSTELEYGRAVIIGEFKEKNQLYFTVFVNQTTQFPLTYAIKYTTSPATNGFPIYTLKNRQISHTKNGTNLQAQWESVVDRDGKTVPASYTFKVFTPNKEENYKALKSICVLIPPKYSYQFPADRSYVDIPVANKNDFFSLSLVASFQDKEEEEFLMAYAMKDIQKPSDTWIIIVSVVSALVIAVIAVIFYFFLVKKKNNNELNEANVGPLVDDG